jgi:hypothetical protein
MESSTGKRKIITIRECDLMAEEEEEEDDIKRKRRYRALSNLNISMNDALVDSRQGRQVRKRCQECHSFKEDCTCDDLKSPAPPFRASTSVNSPLVSASGKRRGRPPKNISVGLNALPKDLDPFLSENNYVDDVTVRDNYLKPQNTTNDYPKNE